MKIGKHVLVYLMSIACVLLFAKTNAFAYGSLGDNVNDDCAPVVVYTGDCATCHIGSKGDDTDAKDAYNAGGTVLTDFFCPPVEPVDADGDGYNVDVDCNDSNADINPGAFDIPNNNVDENCDGADATDESLLDTDNDGFAPVDGDCDDSNADVFPGAVEDCTDLIDNDCDNLVDAQDANAVGCPVECIDIDQDFYYINGGECGPTDCDDDDANVNPGAEEICDNFIDDNCDTLVDNGCVVTPPGDESCTDYGDRGSCKADSRCKYSRKKGCYEVIDVSGFDQYDCDDAGGRWNKKKETCRIR